MASWVAQIRSKDQFQKIATLAMVFCLSVVLGNAAIRFIPLSFSQAIGATTPLFTAVLAAVMLKKREPVLVYSTLIPVVVGIVIATGACLLWTVGGKTASNALGMHHFTLPLHPQSASVFYVSNHQHRWC